MSFLPALRNGLDEVTTAVRPVVVSDVVLVCVHGVRRSTGSSSECVEHRRVFTCEGAETETNDVLIWSFWTTSGLVWTRETTAEWFPRGSSPLHGCASLAETSAVWQLGGARRSPSAEQKGSGPSGAQQRGLIVLRLASTASCWAALALSGDF